MKGSGIDEVKILDFPRIHDARGNLTVIEEEHQVPFEIRRVYWLYDVPAGSERGGHSHIATQECLIALAGSFCVTVTDGEREKRVTLNRPFQGLLIPPGIWRTINDFAAGSVCLVAASDFYREEDYIRDYQDFLSSKKA